MAKKVTFGKTGSHFHLSNIMDLIGEVAKYVENKPGSEIPRRDVEYDPHFPEKIERDFHPLSSSVPHAS